VWMAFKGGLNGMEYVCNDCLKKFKDLELACLHVLRENHQIRNRYTTKKCRRKMK